MKEILDGVFAINMFEKIDIDVILNRNKCYFVCEHIDDVDFIKALAKFLKKEGAREVNFFGKQKDLWHKTFDRADMEVVGLTSLASLMVADIMLTGSIDDQKQLVDEINLYKNSFKETIYLFYDDEQIFDEVLTEIK